MSQRLTKRSPVSILLLSSDIPPMPAYKVTEIVFDVDSFNVAPEEYNQIQEGLQSKVIGTVIIADDEEELIDKIVDEHTAPIAFSDGWKLKYEQVPCKRK